MAFDGPSQIARMDLSFSRASGMNAMKTAIAYLPFFLAVGTALYLGRPQYVPGEDPSPAFDGGRAFQETRAIVGDGAPRTPGSASHDRARSHIEMTLAGLPGIEVEVEEFLWRGLRFRNIVGRMEGSAEGRIVLGAHYDSRPGTPGAVDNASGVGILLETARVLSEKEWEKTIHFGFWDGEEDGLLGSRHYVQSLGPAESDAILAAVCLDMPGWRNGKAVIHTFQRAWEMDAQRIVPSWLPHLVLASADRAGAPLAVGDPWIPIHYQIGVRRVQVPFASDDGPFREAGIPALFMSNSSFLKFFPQYHQAGDTIDLVGEEAIEDCGRTLVTAVAGLDALPRRPDPGPEGYLFIGSFLLGPLALRGVTLLSLLPLFIYLLGKDRQRLDQILGAAVMAAGLTAAVLPETLILPAVGIPLAITFPLLGVRSGWALKAFAIVGLLPALSLIFFHLLLWARTRGHATLLLTPGEWAGLTVAPLLFLIQAVRRERRLRSAAGRVKAGPVSS